jgi:DNA-binding phage protein
MMTDEVKPRWGCIFEESGFEGILYVLAVIKGIQQTTDTLFDPGRQNGVGRNDLAKTLVENAGNPTAQTVYPLEAQALEQKIDPRVGLRVTVLQNTGRPQGNSDFQVGNDVRGHPG